MKWPDGNEDSLWGMAEDWHTHADQMRALGDHIDVAKAAAQVAYPFGDGGEAMVAELEKMRSGNGSIEELADWMDKIGNSAHGMGTETEYTKIMFYATLVTLAIDLAAAPLTGPAMGAAEAAAVGAARVAVRFLTRRLLSEAAKRAAESAAAAVVKYTVRHIALNTIIGTATDAGIQAAQMIEGTRDNFDLGQLGITALTSAGAGAIGGPIGAGIGKGLATPVSNLLGNRAGTYISHAVGGMVGGGIAGGAGGLYSLATGGEFDWRTVTGGAAQGATSGLRQGALEYARTPPKTIDATTAHPSDLTRTTAGSETPQQPNPAHTNNTEQNPAHPSTEQGAPAHPTDAAANKQPGEAVAPAQEHQSDLRTGLGDTPQHPVAATDSPRIGENHSGVTILGDPSQHSQIASADRSGTPSGTNSGSPAHTAPGSNSPTPIRTDAPTTTKPADALAAGPRPTPDASVAPTTRPGPDTRSALPTDIRSSAERPESSPLQTRSSGTEVTATSTRDPQAHTDRTVQAVSAPAEQSNAKTATNARLEPGAVTPVPLDRAPTDRAANHPVDSTAKPRTNSPAPERAPRNDHAEEPSPTGDLHRTPDTDHDEAAPRGEDHPDDRPAPAHPDEKQPAPERPAELEPNPDRPESLTPHLTTRFEELRALAREIVLADTDPARQHELPDLRADFADRFQKLGLLDTDRAATPWRLLDEHQPALAKYLGDNEKFFLPDHSEPSPPHSLVDQPNTDSQTHSAAEEHETGHDAADLPFHDEETAATNAAIDQVLGEVNPHFDPTQSAYSENCTSCVQAYEIRRRGLTGPELTAGPLEKPLRTEEGGPGGRPIAEVTQAWGGEWQTGTRAEIEAAFSEPGSRGAVFISWSSGGGHVFTVENVGGSVRFLDSQPRPPVLDASHYFDHGGNTAYVRLDDKPTPPFTAVEKYVELAIHTPEQTSPHETHPEPTSEKSPAPIHPDETHGPVDSESDHATPHTSDHPDNTRAPSHLGEEQPARPHEPNPDRPDSLTPHLQNRFEDLRALSKEIVLADTDPTRQHELPGLRDEFADRFNRLGLLDTDKTATPWRLLDEHQPALAKYLGDNERFFLPDDPKPAGSGPRPEPTPATEGEPTAGNAPEHKPLETADDAGNSTSEHHPTPSGDDEGIREVSSSFSPVSPEQARQLLDDAQALHDAVSATKQGVGAKRADQGTTVATGMFEGRKVYSVNNNKTTRAMRALADALGYERIFGIEHIDPPLRTDAEQILFNAVDDATLPDKGIIGSSRPACGPERQNCRGRADEYPNISLWERKRTAPWERADD